MEECHLLIYFFKKTPTRVEAMPAQHLGSLVLLHELKSPKHSVSLDKHKKL